MNKSIINSSNDIYKDHAKRLSDNSSIYFENHQEKQGGSSYYYVGLSHLVNEITTKGKDCTKIDDVLLKEYCYKNKYKQIIKALEKLKTTCNSSTEQYICRKKIQEDILKHNIMIQKSMQKINNIELENVEYEYAKTYNPKEVYENEYRDFKY
jgi:hypothetical protein